MWKAEITAWFWALKVVKFWCFIKKDWRFYDFWQVIYCFTVGRKLHRLQFSTCCLLAIKVARFARSTRSAYFEGKDKMIQTPQKRSNLAIAIVETLICVSVESSCTISVIYPINTFATERINHILKNRKSIWSSRNRQKWKHCGDYHKESG